MTQSVNRRYFMGATGSALGLGMAGCASTPAKPVQGAAGPVEATDLRGSVQALVDQVPLVDTHEHLSPEAERVAALNDPEARSTDFGLLMSHYTDSDLQVAGMPREDWQTLVGQGLAPLEKWRLVAPYYERCRHTGYQLCVRESVRALFDEDDIREDNCEAISQRLREGVQPGFYRRVLRDVANIEHAQVNCLRSPVFRTSEPATDLLSYDLWTIGIASGVNRGTLNDFAGTEVTTLKQAHDTIDMAFERFGPKAIAIKDQSAYRRRLNYENVSDEDAAPLFARFATRGETLAPEELKALQDNLFRRCLRLAAEYKLPVKLHTGYFAGHNSMDMARMRDNICDVARLSREFPDTTFVLMHITYPYQNELIALCKQYTNIYADMCWAWIIDPASATRFLREFIMAAPACKLFTFGGDFIPVELVTGHARIARRGIALGLAQLVAEGWLAESDVPALAERIMRGNARELYDLERVLKA